MFLLRAAINGLLFAHIGDNVINSEYESEFNDYYNEDQNYCNFDERWHKWRQIIDGIQWHWKQFPNIELLEYNNDSTVI